MPPYTRVGAHATAVTYGYWSGLATDGYEWVFRRNGSCGVIPTNDGQACVFASAPADRIGRGGVAVIAEIVAEAAPELSNRLRTATAPTGTRTWRGHPGYMRRAHGPGWALVGDAGYFKDPISAHGLTDALRDAELLARAIIGGLADERSLRSALEHYEETRDRLSIPLFDIVDRIAGHQWDDAEISSLLLRLSAAMTDEVETLAGLDRRAASMTIETLIPSVGTIARRSRTVSTDDIVLFTQMTGDRNPLHYDDRLAAASRFGGIIVQGGVTSGLLNAVVAEDLPGPGSVFLQVNWSFRAPVRPGDRITAEVEVLERRDDKPITTLRTTITNQDGTIVLDGSAVVYREPLATLPS